ncbi:sugar transferase [Aureliella helgolandensis]|uniref:UDP-N-acetylgalactosamine-undecaprenyl-phosphate N-acetylgalactosaminephosphotransferase n=1 Tax=Aureliella helgolandensis TaxID=2527968 RepID=A0A518GF80_9BACT|nr:sugar transferase [Aureliella helgolandensis]QDV27261.1 UDP-N-acetylgalactosamine-undecaprenyl-phosphate N-acetylgalactosaminephosphotransferase [Aureliella helgolandensis]
MNESTLSCTPALGQGLPQSDAVTLWPVRRERLPPVTSESLLAQELATVLPPPWLRQLNLPNSRTNVRCLLPRTRVAKRVLDIVVALTLLIATTPLMLLAAIIVKLTSRGPIFFSQTRVGLNSRYDSTMAAAKQPQEMEGPCRRQQAAYGRPFRIYKFRTMRVDSDAGGPQQVKAGDARIIPAGRWLRKLRIDELPQLVNVLRGEMSMVGPRPECIEYMEELSAKVPNYLQRLGLKPGLTGIAQIEAGYANDLESYRRKVGYDLVYLQNCCLSNDLRVLARTVRVVLTGFGAL